MVNCLYLSFLFFSWTIVLAIPVVRYNKDTVSALLHYLWSSSGLAPLHLNSTKGPCTNGTYGPALRVFDYLSCYIVLTDEV
jgi:hypothetical protein